MKLFSRLEPIGVGASVSQDYLVLPEHKRVFIDLITFGFVMGTTGRCTISILSGGLTYPLIDDYPLTANDQVVTIYPQIHLDSGDGIRMTIANAGAADSVSSLILGVK